jgi:hypothetical protein
MLFSKIDLKGAVGQQWHAKSYARDFFNVIDRRTEKNICSLRFGRGQLSDGRLPSYLFVA